MKFTKIFVKDGFINLLKSFGSSNDTRTQTGYGYTKRISRFYQMLDDLYATSGIAAKVVDIPIEDAFREGRTIEYKENEEDKKKELEEFYIQIDEKIELGLKYARVFGGAALILVSADDDLAKPVTQMRQGDLINIAVVDASQLIPQNLERNPLSSDYLKPAGYTVTGSSQVIDSSRVLYIDGVTTTNRERELNNGFGSSIYERMHKNIEDATQTNVALRNLIEQSNLDVVKMNGLNDAVGSGAEDAVKERIQVISQMKSLLNTIAIDSKDDYVNIAKNFSGLDPIRMNMFMIVGALADIPFTRFMGKSAEGMSATGEGDLRNYYDAVKSKVQIGKMRRIYAFIDPIVNMHLFGVDESFVYEFNPLYQLSDKEIADINKIEADTHAIYIDRGVVTEDAVLVELKKNGTYSDYDPDKSVGFEV